MKRGKALSRTLIRSLLLLLLAFLVALPTGSRAESKSFYWERFDVEITINPDGTFWVVETQVINFTSGTFHYGYRNIDLSRVEKITDVQVWGDGEAYEASGSELPNTFYTEHEGGDLYIYWYFEPTNGRHTYNIRYLVHGGLRYYDEGDQLWWKAVPPDLMATVQASQVVVRLPQGAVAEKTAAYGVDSQIQGEGTRQVTFVANQPISPGTAFEVRVQFPHGVVSGSAPLWQIAEDRKPIINLGVLVLSLLILGVGIVGLILLWYFRGRDPAVKLPADILTEPPSDDPPGVVGTLVDERADTKDIIATLVDLARRGYLVIEEGEPVSLFGLRLKSSELIYRRTDKPTGDLLPYEQILLDRLFSHHTVRSQSDLNERFYRYIPAIQKALYR